LGLVRQRETDPISSLHNQAKLTEGFRSFAKGKYCLNRAPSVPFVAALDRARLILRMGPQHALEKSTLDVERLHRLQRLLPWPRAKWITRFMQAWGPRPGRVRIGTAPWSKPQLNLEWTKSTSRRRRIAGSHQQSIRQLAGSNSVLTFRSQVESITAYFPSSERNTARTKGEQCHFQWHAIRLSEPGRRLILRNGSKHFSQKWQILCADTQVGAQHGTICIVACFPRPGQHSRPASMKRVRVQTSMNEPLLIPQGPCAVARKLSVAVVGNDRK